MEIIFWLSLIILVYTYFCYPLFLWIISKWFSVPIKRKKIIPNISFLVVVHNEGRYIDGKIKNILELDYPRENMEIIVGSDGSTDNTNEIIKSYVDKGVKLCVSQDNVGKVNVLNRLVKEAKNEIIVFSDARQKFEKGALRELVANFHDPSVGCVSGELILKGEDESGVAKGVGFYWRYEKLMRKMESNIHSMIGATGAIYAIRKRLFMPPPPDTILDDVYIPLKIIEKGYRAIFEEKAMAYDKVAVTSREEFTRKVRTLAGNFQVFLLFKNLFNPYKSKIAWQFFSHKFLRAIAFCFLIMAFLTSMFLLGEIRYNVLFAGQVIFYLSAITGWIAEKYNIKNKIVSVPYAFCVLNLAALKGFLRFILGKQKVTWEKAAGKKIDNSG